MAPINARYTLEPNTVLGDGSQNIVDLHSNYRVGTLYQHEANLWSFALTNGNARMGRHSVVIASLKRILTVEGKSLPECKL